MVTAPRTTIVLRLLGLFLACVVAVLAPAAVGITQAAAAEASTCTAATLLVADGFPRRALALLAAPSQLSTDPVCTAAARDAGNAIQRAVTEAKAAEESVDAKDWKTVGTKAATALAADRDNSNAANLQTRAALELAKADAKLIATTEAKKSWLTKLEDQWNAFFDEQLTPMGGLLLPFVGVLFGLVLLSRLVVLVVRQWPSADDLPGDRARRPIFAAGVLSVASASLLASLVASDSNSDPLSWPMTWVAVLVTLSAAGSAAWVSVLARQRAPRTYRVLGTLSLVAAVLALVGLAIRALGGDLVPQTLEPFAPLGLATLLALQGVWLLAWWLATRIRLDVKGPTGAADIGTVVALLSELGAEKPRGLEVPRGADVTALDGVLGSLPENPVLKVLKDIIRSISGVTPWTATIEGDATTRVVTVVRNGKTLGSAIIDPERLGLTPAGDDSTSAAEASTTADKATAPDRTLHMASAFVLTTMARCHPAISRGLAGTTSWKSLGYQYVGSTMRPGTSDTAGRDQMRALLAAALDEDAGNRAARLAFRHAIDRDATDCQTLSRYAQFLKEYCAELDKNGNDFETAELELRAVYTRALILVNAVHAHAGGEHGTGAPACTFNQTDMMEQAKAELDTLQRLAALEDDEPDRDPLMEFKSRFTDEVQGVRYLVGRVTTQPVPTSPVGMYNLGCTFGSRHDVGWMPLATTTTPAADDETARRWLDLACQDSATREWMTTDPQLTGFRARQTYRNTFLTEPRTDFFALSTVAPFAAQLKTAGYGDVSLLAEAEPTDLGAFLSAAPGMCAQMVELARLHRGLTLLSPSTEASGGSGGQAWWEDLVEGVLGAIEAAFAPEEAAPVPLDRWAIEILDQLSCDGLARRESLIALSAIRQSALADELATSLMKEHQPGESDDLTEYQARLSTTLSAWFANPYEPAGSGSWGS